MKNGVNDIEMAGYNGARMVFWKRKNMTNKNATSENISFHYAVQVPNNINTYIISAAAATTSNTFCCTSVQ